MARSHRVLGSPHHLLASFSSRIDVSKSEHPGPVSPSPAASPEMSNEFGNESDFHDNALHPPSLVSTEAPGLPPNLVEFSEVPVSAEVASFYAAFKDTSRDVHHDVPPLSTPLSELHSSCKAMISFVTRKKQTAAEIIDLWRLVSKLDAEVPELDRHVSNAFKTGNALANYVDRARKWHVRNIGWRSAIIRTPFGTNSTGVFRSILDLLLAEIDRAGGLSRIIPFKEDINNDDRVFYGPCSSIAMQQYAADVRQGAHVLGFDIYADGTTLARSGSQSATILRVRFTNIRGTSSKWHEVGISPRLISGFNERTKSEMKTERLHLAQRFLFVAMEDIMKASSSGVMYHGNLIFPRIVCTVADQPQERLFFSLKSAGSFRDCSCCVMESIVPKQKQLLRSNSVEELDRESDTLRSDSNDEFDGSVQGNEDAGSNADIFSRVRQTQLSGNRQCGRNVFRTVKYQLLVARGRQSTARRNRRGVEMELKKARDYLKAFSALEFPPALAAFHGLGTWPFRLYSSIGFDKLHAVDLGVQRSIPDLAFKRLSSFPYLTMPVSQQIRIINQRLLDLPKSSRLPKISLFRYSADQKQPGMSGGIRRQFSPFIWVALMGIAESVVPDDDPLLQASLSLSSATKKIIGCNEALSNLRRTENDIKDLQLVCYDAGLALSRALDLKISTKIHRLMYHVTDHLYSFGCMRWGCTDENEVLHKDTKAAYHATNSRPDQLLLSARIELCVSDARDSIYTPEIEQLRETAEFSIPERIRANVQYTMLKVQACTTVESAEQALLNARHASTHALLWRQVRAITITPKFDWWPNPPSCSQTIYAGKNIYGAEVRRDAVQYMPNNKNEALFGIVQAIFQNMSHENLKLVLIRVLEETAPSMGNTKVVYDHGNKRLKYKLNNCGDAQMELVTVEQIKRLAMIVPDTYDTSVRHGLRAKISNLPDNSQERQLARFFEVSAFQFTSLPQWGDDFE